MLGTPPLVNAKILIYNYEIKLSTEEFIKKRDELLIEHFSKSTFKKGARETTYK